MSSADIAKVVRVNRRSPSEAEVRDALARLISHGVRSVWLPEIQPLFELSAVQAKLTELGEDREADALREVLRSAVEGMGKSQYRSLLTIVLGLDPRYEDLQAGAKREIAGREFRGGDRPVSAGTIRQHHEPRALDELARLLVSPEAETGVAPPPMPELSGDRPFEWHPHVHRRWAGEQLIFWRLSIAGYRRTEAVERIRSVMREANVCSWSAYELLGVFDVLLSAWVPATGMESEIRSGLLGAFAGRLELIDSLIVDRIVLHWAWSTKDGSLRPPAPEVMAEPLPPNEIDQLNKGGSELDLSIYRELGVIAPPQPPPAGVIGFFVALGLQGHALVLSAAHRNLEDQIVKVIREASSQGAFSGLRIFEGSGFANFLIHGNVQAERFAELTQLLVRLADAEAFASPRINTFIASGPVPVAREEAMRGGATAAPQEQSLIQLLEQGEGEQLDIKPAAFTELGEFGSGAPEGRSSSRPGYALAKLTTAFLNSDGGTILIGAVEDRLLDRRPELRETPFVESAPHIGRYAVTGIDHELGPDIDFFERRLRALFTEKIEPEPARFLQISAEKVNGRTVCAIRILATSAGAARWFYCRSPEGKAGFWVRQGSAVTLLEGLGADQYKMSEPRR